MQVLAVILEVMDKEPSLPLLAVLFLALGLVGFITARHRPWLTTVPLVLSVLLAAGRIAEMNDPLVGPAIRDEAGWGYILASYGLMAFSVFLPLLGLVRRRKAARDQV